MASKKSSGVRPPSRAQVKQTLECTLKLFADKKNFATGKWAANARGGSLYNPKDPDACSWCLEGALMKCSPDFPAEGATHDDADAVSAVYRAVIERLEANLPSDFKGPLYDLNDSPGYGLPAVRRLLRKGLKSFEKKV